MKTLQEQMKIAAELKEKELELRERETRNVEECRSSNFKIV